MPVWVRVRFSFFLSLSPLLIYFSVQDPGVPALFYTHAHNNATTVYPARGSISLVQKQPQTSKRVSFDYSLNESEDEMPEAELESMSESTNKAERAVVEKTLIMC